jgi:branched-chain amino acid transport system ATP-binding protein
MAPSDVAKRVFMVMSGGTEGGLSPHFLVFAAGQDAASTIEAPFPRGRLFGGLSVLESVKVAAAQRTSQSLWDVLARTTKHHKAETEITAIARSALESVGLSTRADDEAKSLSYAQQRPLEIARALAAKPKLLLLDEPTAGMNMSESMGLLEMIAKLRTAGLTILLIEHNVRLVMGISDHIKVLDFGKVIASGPPAAARDDPAVITAYLGRRCQAA